MAGYLGREAEPLKSGCPVKDQIGQNGDLERSDQVGLCQALTILPDHPLTEGRWHLAFGSDQSLSRKAHFPEIPI